MNDDVIKTTLDLLGLDVSSLGTLLRFVDLFAKWNASINLSAASSRSDVVEHVVDSLHVVPFLQNASSILDVGSGGGFPVVVAAICLPNRQLTALEPVHKKHAFLKTAVRELGLTNLLVLAERLDAHRTAHYDAACSRATFDLIEWIHLGLGHVKPGGIVVGFEAIPRSDLPPTITRQRYSLAGKQRAIVVAIKD